MNLKCLKSLKLVLLSILIVLISSTHSNAGSKELSGTKRLKVEGEFIASEINIYSSEFDSYIKDYERQYINQLDVQGGLNVGVPFPNDSYYLDMLFPTGVTHGESSFTSLIDSDIQYANNAIMGVFNSIINGISNGGRYIDSKIKLDRALYNFLIEYPNISYGQYDKLLKDYYYTPIVTDKQYNMPLGNVLSIFPSNKLLKYRSDVSRLKTLIAGANTEESSEYFKSELQELLDKKVTVEERIESTSMYAFYDNAVYKSHYNSNKPLLIMSRDQIYKLASRSATFKVNFLNYIKSATITISDFKSDGKPVELNSGDKFKLGKNLIEYINKNKYNTTERVYIDMLNSSQYNEASMSLAVNSDYVDVVNSKDKYAYLGDMTFFKVEYPFYQPSKINIVDKDSFQLNFEKAGDINLLNEVVKSNNREIGIAQVIGDMDSSLTYISTYSESSTLQDMGYIQSNSVMECLEINGEYYPTGRIIKLPTGEFNRHTLVHFANSTLLSVTKPQVDCYIFDTEDDSSNIRIVQLNNPEITGKGIVLNPVKADQAGLLSFYNNEVSAMVKENYNVNVDKITMFLTGGFSLPSGEFSHEHMTRIDQINKALEVGNIREAVSTVRVIMIILGFFLMLYALLLFIALSTDRSGGIFGIQLLKVLTFGKLGLQVNVGNTGGLKVSLKRVLTAIIGILIVAITLITGVLYQLVVVLATIILEKTGG